eukprot:GILI01002498.1.p1 GENE.GILI01002498.1~~GILI01002498.1.p1  ORF type:complete len:120 (-),score=31.07 GILI01002498.1:135-494(-)
MSSSSVSSKPPLPLTPFKTRNSSSTASPNGTPSSANRRSSEKFHTASYKNSPSASSLPLPSFDYTALSSPTPSPFHAASPAVPTPPAGVSAQADLSPSVKALFLAAAPSQGHSHQAPSW